MAVKTLTFGHSFEDDKRKPWRKKARERLSRAIKGQKDPRIRGGVRRETALKIAVAVNREAIKRTFRAAKIKGRKRQKQVEERLYRLKLSAIRLWKPDLDDMDAENLANAATLVKVGRSRRALLLSKKFYYDSKRKRWRRGEAFRERGIWTVRGVGPSISESTVRRSLAASAYWSRVKALARALGVPVGEARRLDRIMLHVPDRVRRRIYERLVNEAVRELRGEKSRGRRKRV